MPKNLEKLGKCLMEFSATDIDKREIVRGHQVLVPKSWKNGKYFCKTSDHHGGIALDTLDAEDDETLSTTYFTDDEIEKFELGHYKILKNDFDKKKS